jgi:hypothetical protein
MKTLTFFLGLTVLLTGFTGCKKDEKTPCQRLVEQEAKCGFEKGVAVGDCEKNIQTVQIRTALDCLKAKECQEFLPCRREADELKGLQTGLENL